MPVYKSPKKAFMAAAGLGVAFCLLSRAVAATFCFRRRAAGASRTEIFAAREDFSDRIYRMIVTNWMPPA